MKLKMKKRIRNNIDSFGCNNNCNINFSTELVFQC